MKHSKLIVSILAIAAAGAGAAYFMLRRGASPPRIGSVKEHMSSEQLALSDPLENSVGMILVPIPSGEFPMGTPMPKNKKPGPLKPELPQHRVTISKPFYISAYEVTQGQYEAVMGERPWDGQPLTETGPHFAASYISWEKAVAFCEQLSKQEGKTYRLPTEAEWEYACRAGSTTHFCFGDDEARLEEYAWYGKNSDEVTHAVGGKKANEWGLHDMHGNVWEWCADWYGTYLNKAVNDPQGPNKGVRVLRGGSWARPAELCRSAYRGYAHPYARNEYVGFRVVLARRSAEPKGKVESLKSKS